jgi:hypothetical protein
MGKSHKFIEYFSYIDAFSFLKLSVANVGNIFDEDIDVKLFVKKDVIVKIEKIKRPEIYIIDELVKTHFIDIVFSVPENEALESYAYYPTIKSLNKKGMSTVHLNGRSPSEEYEMKKTEFNEILKQKYCYKIFDNKEEDIFMFHIDYLRHNKAMMFPAALMLQDVPKTIKYEITSKHIPDVVKGEIKITNKESIEC